jgi:alpha-galactosidase
MIAFDALRRIFHLQGRETSYLIGISRTGDVRQLHWGPALAPVDVESLVARWKKLQESPLLEMQHREYASYGNNDLRSPALLLSHADGSRLSHFLYQGHDISPGKPDFPGPQAYVESPAEASTLRLMLKDGLTGQLLDLFYTLYPGLDIITRRAVILQGDQAGAILRFMSASVDMPAAPYWCSSLPGDWARERMVQQAPLRQGILRLEGRRGQNHRMSPFVALSDAAPQEEEGQAWGLSLVYSGNWLLEAELQSNGRLRLNAGLNDFDFRWQLEPGESFAAPECILAFSPKGVGGLSRKMHDLTRSRICRGPWRDAARPILVNSWESNYFNFKHGDILKLARDSQDLGVELLVLDDGWFGTRDSDTSSLGDWFDDKRKLPFGVKGLAEEVHALGMKFGLWFEPEMVSPASKLYHEHPDWALSVPGRPSTTSRNQLVLDMSRDAVRDYLFERLVHFVEEAKLDYIKWDMNRPLWEVGSYAWPAERQAELSHRCMMGTYELMGRLRDRFPQLLVEGCCGGGGRFDLGMLCYHPQFWASDNTDPLDRIRIQWGSSLFLPPSTMGAHVSAVPNHQTGRSTPISLRGHVAMSGLYGLELDPARLSQEERHELAAQIAMYRQIRHLVQQGSLYRLADPATESRPAWSFVSPDKAEALIFVFQPLVPLRGLDPLPLALHGLDGHATYEIEGLGQRWSGAQLMAQGFIPELGQGDYQSALYRLRAVK